jgi:hypothetical protein
MEKLCLHNTSKRNIEVSGGILSGMAIAFSCTIREKIDEENIRNIGHVIILSAFENHAD